MEPQTTKLTHFPSFSPFCLTYLPPPPSVSFLFSLAICLPALVLHLSTYTLCASKCCPPPTSPFHPICPPPWPSYPCFFAEHDGMLPVATRLALTGIYCSCLSESVCTASASIAVKEMNVSVMALSAFLMTMSVLGGGGGGGMTGYEPHIPVRWRNSEARNTAAGVWLQIKVTS